MKERGREKLPSTRMSCVRNFVDKAAELGLLDKIYPHEAFVLLARWHYGQTAESIAPIVGVITRERIFQLEREGFEAVIAQFPKDKQEILTQLLKRRITEENKCRFTLMFADIDPQFEQMAADVKLNYPEIKRRRAKLAIANSPWLDPERKREAAQRQQEGIRRSKERRALAGI